MLVKQTLVTLTSMPTTPIISKLVVYAAHDAAQQSLSLRLHKTEAAEDDRIRSVQGYKGVRMSRGCGGVRYSCNYISIVIVYITWTSYTFDSI